MVKFGDDLVDVGGEEVMDSGKPAFMSPACTKTGILEPQGAIPPDFDPFWRGLVYRLAPEVLLFKGMLMGPEAFFGMPGMSGLQPSTWAHL